MRCGVDAAERAGFLAPRTSSSSLLSKVSSRLAPFALPLPFAPGLLIVSFALSRLIASSTSLLLLSLRACSRSSTVSGGPARSKSASNSSLVRGSPGEGGR